jgi:hypothetical protein
MPALESPATRHTPDARAPARRSSDAGLKLLAQVAAVALAFFVVAGWLESSLTRILQPSEAELDWVSDAVESLALGVATYLWLHLRATRRELTTRERVEVALQTQLSIAEDMQRRLLPSRLPIGGGFDWGAVLVPAGRIGGDFYDFVEPVPGVWVMLIADVSGKGIAAAMALTLLRSTFRSVARETGRPADVLMRMSAVFYDEWHGTPYVTAIVARFAAHEQTLTYANAGHPAGVLVGSSEDRQLTVGGPPLGLFEAARFREEHIDLKDGDVCVFVTDGITEAFGTTAQPACATIAAAVRNEGRTADAACHVVLSRALEGHGPEGVDGWEDDRTVIATIVRREAAPGATIQALETQNSSPNRLQSFSRALSLSERARQTSSFRKVECRRSVSKSSVSRAATSS